MHKVVLYRWGISRAGTVHSVVIVDSEDGEDKFLARRTRIGRITDVQHTVASLVVVETVLLPPDPAPVLKPFLVFPWLYPFNNLFGYRERAFCAKLQFFTAIAKKASQAGRRGHCPRRAACVCGVGVEAVIAGRVAQLLPPPAGCDSGSGDDSLGFGGNNAHTLCSKCDIHHADLRTSTQNDPHFA